MSVNTSQFKAMRQHMVESQLRPSDVNDPAILAAMALTPREAYVPADLASISYMDRSIALGEDRYLNPPLTIGRMLVEADIRRTDDVLLIGAATGYTADLISRLAHKVVAVEESASLAAHARTALGGRDNLTLIEGPLAGGSTTGALYDVLIVDGAVEEIPENLVRQVKPDGRVITALDDRGVIRLVRGVRVGDQLSFIPFADMEAAPLPGFAKPKAFTF